MVNYVQPNLKVKWFTNHKLGDHGTLGSNLSSLPKYHMKTIWLKKVH